MRTEHTSGFARALTLACLVGVASLTTACRQDMHDQAKFEPYEASDLFADGSSARQLVAHTVPRGERYLKEDQAFYTGKDEGGQFLTAFPKQMTREDILRGKQRFEIFCTPCHDRTGSGNGMIVQRGFYPPTSFHDERLRAEAPGYFFSVMTEGFGQMSGYSAQIKAEDRWRIAAYIKTLQLSQNVRLAELPADAQETLQRAVAAGGSLREGAGGGDDHGSGSHDSGGHGTANHGAADGHGDDHAADDHGSEEHGSTNGHSGER